MFKRSYHRLVGQIAIVAILFSSLAPTLSHAFAAKNSTQLISQEICTSQGIKPVVSSSTDVVIDNKSQAPEQSSMHFEHCPYCFSHAGSVALPPSPMAVFLAALNSPLRIEAYASPVLISYTTTTHPSRAPPSL